ncbi:MAG: hypothetical protein AB8F95_04915 [Bacteroidia bacterium]
MPRTNTTPNTELDFVLINGEGYFKIANSDALRPFFMSIVSDDNHWMFISSNGGLSAGRKDSENALFPYYTDDKITESADLTGSKSIFQVQKDGQTHIWEPFSERFTGRFKITRNLYKHQYGNAILFEEENHDLGLTFRYAWKSSNLFGFVRQSFLVNASTEDIEIAILDGIQNIMPYGVGSETQNRASNLVDAYKRSELDKESGLGIFALSAIIVDKAEPSEALKANIAWSIGLDNPKHLLSSLQLNTFRKGGSLEGEEDVKAEKGAYFIHKNIRLAVGAEKDWMILADVNKDHNAVAATAFAINKNEGLKKAIHEDIAKGTYNLIKLNASSDGIQQTSDKLRDTRHFANSLFNIMRGGIFSDQYKLERRDIANYLQKANAAVFNEVQPIIETLPETISLAQLHVLAHKSENAAFQRLCLEYLPLTFSRRHGDPSRPWNKFSINTRSEVDGSKILDYEGNWRDIFQNWEALAHSFPSYMESMIHKFLNATTFDGYNPYRVTKDGFDWEIIEPDDPWSYIGYWGDHQIIYLLKFLEFIEKYKPGSLNSYFDKSIFVYANVPYKIKPYADILKNPKDTIDFDAELDDRIHKERETLGADAALIQNQHGDIYTVNFVEKILATLLAKLSNFIPEGGIWMNTQRPEWNDANNALVGNGVSMVTLYYLRRFLTFFHKIIANSETDSVAVSSELAVFFSRVSKAFAQNQQMLSGSINDTERKRIMDLLGQAGSDYREEIYGGAFSGKKEGISLDDIRQFVESSLKHLEHTIEANKRSDNLYHAYNIMTVENDKEVSISYLSEMLEGQVAVLSAGYLQPQEVVEVLNSLKDSALFREDQQSYLLYPNKDLPRFNAKNTVSLDAVLDSKLLSKLLEDGNQQIIKKDVNGKHHFNGNFRNANDLKEGLRELDQKIYGSLVQQDEQAILQTFEDIFNHKAFTGRSGTFFGYEGLGSIYWHMVSKLQLAVMECCFQAIESGADKATIDALVKHYYEINEGIGVHKSPAVYGAFPTDPYSHTPGGKGAQQPGMTGQVKEDIISRYGELGVFVEAGKLYFQPGILRKIEFLNEETSFEYIDATEQAQELELGKGSLCFTYCQVPIVYTRSDRDALSVVLKDGTSKEFSALSLDVETSKLVFERTGDIIQINVHVQEAALK